MVIQGRLISEGGWSWYAAHWGRIRRNLSIARKNGLNDVDALQRVFFGHAFVPTPNTS